MIEVKALVELAAQGKTDLLLKLLGPQTDVNRPDESGTTPLHAAAGGGHRDIVSALLEHGASINARRSAPPCSITGRERRSSGLSRGWAEET